MTEDHKQPPQNVKEVGIHIGYLQEYIGAAITVFVLMVAILCELRSRVGHN